MAVKVVKDGGTLKFYPETAADNDTADYLCRLTNDARAVVKSADGATVAKSGLAGIALVRKAQEDKLAILKDVADRCEQKAMDTSVS